MIKKCRGIRIFANACSALNTHRVEFPFKQKNSPTKWIPENTQAKPPLLEN